jgi:phosphopantetheine--protein transferase-like protein
VAPPAAFRLDLPHGRCVGVAIPAALTPALREALAPEEIDHLDRLPPARQAAFAAGRAALRAALADLGLPGGPILPDDRGAPRLPPGALGSISHKRALAVALAAPAVADGTSLGIDLEEDRPTRVDIAPRVLTPDERDALAALAGDERARQVLARFSLKEAFYKAVHAIVRRNVSFQEVEVGALDGQGRTRFSGPLVERHTLVAEGALHHVVAGHALATARVVPLPGWER